MKILVLDERAEQYKTFLGHLEHNIEYHQTLPDDFECQALLASPGLAAGALAAGCEPKWIQSTWAGVDALLPLLEERSIRLTGIKGIFGQLMSEYVFAHILADLRDLSFFSAKQVKRQWHEERLPGTLAGKTMVIVGAGSIGEHLAQTARHFSMHAIGVNRSGSEQSGFDEVTQDLISAVQAADYVVSSLPNTNGTQKLFNREVFHAMPDQCTFINVGRGSSVDEEALLNALQTGEIRRAVLDVFAQEPLSTNHPFWHLENLVITPHIAAPSFAKDIAAIFLDNLTRFIAGEPLLHQIDIERGY